MADYTQLDEIDIRNVLAQYDLQFVDFSPLDGGASNSSYCVHTEIGTFVLTVFDNKSPDYVYQLGQLLMLLETLSFPTTRLKHSIGLNAYHLHNNKPIMLKRFINGQTCASLDGAMISQIGASLAQLHCIPVPDFLPKQHAYGLEVFKIAIGKNIHPPFESWLMAQRDELIQKIPSDLPMGLIHGDCFFDNVLFDGLVLTAIIDFEEACHYYRVFDLGMAIVGLCAQGASINLDKARALLDGYQQREQLFENEKIALQLFVEYAATATAFWRFWKYNIHAPSLQGEISCKPFEMQALAQAVQDIPQARFLKAVFGDIEPSNLIGANRLMLEAGQL